MPRFDVEKIKDGGKIYYLIFEDFNIIKEPTKYLKFKTLLNLSPNTVRRIAFALKYYLSFLSERKLNIDAVVNLPYMEQYGHFEDFLQWIFAGRHTKRSNSSPGNNTCNAYLQSVFGFYVFLTKQYQKKALKVLETRSVIYANSVGVNMKANVKSFKGYLVPEESHGRTISKSDLIRLLNASDSLRNRLIILLLAETGFRIGELLGIRFQDIDSEERSIRVVFRNDNENVARAKNAEYREAVISDETYNLLLYYLAENRKLLSKSEYLFIALNGPTKGRPLTVSAVYSMFRVLEKKSGLKTNPHSLRHYYANERRKAGWRLEQISSSLGHKQLRTTEKYLNVEKEETRAAMQEFFSQNKGVFDIEKVI